MNIAITPTRLVINEERDCPPHHRQPNQRILRTIRKMMGICVAVAGVCCVIVLLLSNFFG